MGYISLDEDLPFARSVSDGIRDAVERAELRVVACDSGWSRQGVERCIDELAAAGVGSVLSFQPFGDLRSRLCEAFEGRPVVGIVFEQGPCQASLLGIDQAASGRLAGEAVGRFASERWECEASAWLSLTSTQADPDVRARMQGYRDGFTAHCPLPERVLSLEGADRVATARQRVAEALPEVDGDRVIVVGLNEDAILGAMAAAAAAGRESGLWYSGQLADPSIRERIACDEQYIASVAQSPERFGELLVPTLLDALAGRPVPRRSDAPLELVTAANVRRLFPDTRSCDE